MADSDAAAVFPFFVGCGRSGTTLFGLMFDSHPDMAVAHEAHFVVDLARKRSRLLTPGGFEVASFVEGVYANPNFRRLSVPRPEVAAEVADAGDYPSAVRGVFRVLARQRGKTLYGDKTPGYVTHLPLLARLFPEARFVHIVRDGRDVALAYVERPEWGPSTIGAAAWNWRSRVARARAAGRKLGPERYLEVRYEHLVTRPEQTLREVCAFVGVDYSPQMLEFQQRGKGLAPQTGTPEAFASLSKPLTAGLRDWRSQMSKADQGLFEAVARRQLDAFGYPLTDAVTWRSRAAAVGEAVKWQLERVEARIRPRAR